jgi:hypothetical protein
MAKETERVKAIFTVNKETWKKFKVKVTLADRKYSDVIEELIEKYLEK